MNRLPKQHLSASNLKALQAGKNPFRLGSIIKGDRNLYLRINSASTASWVFVYYDKGRRFEEGLGSLTGTGRYGVKVSLTDARKRADRRRVELDSGVAVTPQPGRRRKKAPAGTPTFEAVMNEFLSVQKWRVSSPVATPRTTIFRNAMERYCAPLLNMPVTNIELEHVIACLKPIWDKDKGESTRFKIYQVLRFAQVDHRKSMDNPADKMVVEHKLGKQELDVKGRKMLPWKDLPVFMETILASDKVGARAIELVVYSQMRSEAVRLARWDEVDWENEVWTIPAERMKDTRRSKGPKPAAFIVPLCRQAVAMLRAMQAASASEYVFARKGKLVSNQALRDTCKQLGYSPDIMTPHGLRSTFQSFLAASTEYSDRDGLACLAHVQGQSETPVGRRYQRDAMVEKRRKIMQTYADYAHRAPNANILQFPKKADA